jgi:hypothetical protein
VFNSLRQLSDRKASSARAVRPALEALEDRCVPTVVFTPHFDGETVTAQHPEAVLRNPPVYLIFHGPYWGTAGGQAEVSWLRQAAMSILGGPYLSGLVQYGSDGKVNYQGSYVDTSAAPDNASPTQVRDFLQGVINDPRSPIFAPGYFSSTPVYVVITQPNATNDFGGFNQRMNADIHENGASGTTNEPLTYVKVGTSNGGVYRDMDKFTLTFSHEMAEVISDPGGTGVKIGRPAGLPASIKGDDQIGDLEPDYPNGVPGYGYRLNGYLVQPYWSDRVEDKAFIVPDGNAQRFVLSPIWNGDNFTGTYDLSVQGDQLGFNYADNIRVGVNAATSGAQVTMNNETVGFDNTVGGKPVIQSISVDTRGGDNFVLVAAAPVGVTVNIDSWGFSNDIVQVGDGGSLASLQGSTVNVSNTSGHTHLIIDASQDGAHDVTLTDHSVAFAGLATVNYRAGGVNQLDVIDGVGFKWVDVESTSSLTAVTLWASSDDCVRGPASGLVNVQRTHA